MAQCRRRQCAHAEREHQPRAHRPECTRRVRRDETAPDARRRIQLTWRRGPREAQCHRQQDHHPDEEHQPGSIRLRAHATEQAKRMDRRNERQEQRGRNADQVARPASQAGPHGPEDATSRRARAAGRHIRRDEDRARQEQREQQQRDAGDLSLEGRVTHGTYRSRSGPSLVIWRSW
jgi:hypothetical protein